MSGKKRDTPWMDGNKHAYKGMDSALHINCRKRDKAGWVRQSKKDNRTNLTEWVIETLNKAVEKE
jgi:hypothetical protein